MSSITTRPAYPAGSLSPALGERGNKDKAPSLVERLLQRLADYGLVLPATTTAANFLERLRVALVALQGAGRTLNAAGPPVNRPLRLAPQAAADGESYHPTRMSTAHAPAGGTTVAGKHFEGGEFIPSAADFDAVAKAGSGHVGGWHVEHIKGGEFKILTERGVLRGDKAKIADFIDLARRNEHSEGKRIKAAMQRVENWEEPNPFSEAAREQDAAFQKLPHGTRVVSLAGHTKGRLGGIVKTHEAGYPVNRVRLDGAAGFLMTDDVEPLDEKLSWRVKDRKKEPEQHRPEQGTLFATKAAGGRWIQIGTKLGKDGKKHGGTPVFIENGRITKGHPSLTGRKIDTLKEEPAAGEGPTHRQQLNQSKGHARAVWGKKARQAGIPAEHLHQLAGEMLAHDKAYKSERMQVLQAARQAFKRRGFGDVSNLRTHVGRGNIEDEASLKGLDDVSKSLAAQFPEALGDESTASAKLFDLLGEGNAAVEPMTEERALEEAFDHLVSAKHQGSDRCKESGTGDEWDSPSKEKEWTQKAKQGPAYADQFATAAELAAQRFLDKSLPMNQSRYVGWLRAPGQILRSQVCHSQSLGECERLLMDYAGQCRFEAVRVLPAGVYPPEKVPQPQGAR